MLLGVGTNQHCAPYCSRLAPCGKLRSTTASPTRTSFKVAAPGAPARTHGVRMKCEVRRVCPAGVGGHSHGHPHARSSAHTRRGVPDRSPGYLMPRFCSLIVHRCSRMFAPSAAPVGSPARRADSESCSSFYEPSIHSLCSLAQGSYRGRLIISQPAFRFERWR